MATCEAMIFVKSEGLERQCKSRGQNDIGGKWYCTKHDPTADAYTMNRWHDTRKREKKIFWDLSKHDVTDEQIADGILDRALTMLRESETQ